VLWLGGRRTRPRAPGRLDHPHHLVEWARELLDVVLGERARGARHQDEASERRLAGAQRHAGDAAQGGTGLDERWNVVRARGGVDQVRAVIAQALERQRPAPGVVLPDAAQRAAALVGDPDLGGEPEEPVAHVEET